ncbi:MAG: AAA family ATPase [Gemmatimonadetes bacterium]|nr:AAA family ATPase [Gemmatimonadota bacterium]
MTNTSERPLEEGADVARTRVHQLFEFLRAYAERKAPATYDFRGHPEVIRIKDLPVHPAIQLGTVQLASATEALASEGAERPLLSVRRPASTPAPAPPPSLVDWLNPGWEEPEGAAPTVIDERNVPSKDGGAVELFTASSSRAADLRTWREQWDRWATSERPCRNAIAVFERLFALRARMAQEGERLELLIATGRLVWKAPAIGEVDHPILLQRVELAFDPSGPSISIVDADQEPELYLPVLAIGSGGMGPLDSTALRDELSARQYHPLESAATPEYLRRIALLLHARGEYHESWSPRNPIDEPHLVNDPMLLLRVRGAGFAAAISRVLNDIVGGGEIPVGLARLVGIDRLNVDPLAGLPDYSPWGEPPDILLSKPANEEQVQIAQALARYRAVLVQGPPGTGKSHTIANLIGHLVSEGKRVLVTSHTTKALSVLRDKVEPLLQPLCLALLDNDAESRKQLEQAVRAILSRLTQSSAPALAERERQLSRERERLLAAVAQCTDDLRTVREAEYRALAVGGDAVAPAEGARWLVEMGPGHGWIEGRVDPGHRCPFRMRIYGGCTRATA